MRHATSIPPYTSKHFEIGLSPIIEDTLRSLKSLEKNPATSGMVSTSIIGLFRRKHDEMEVVLVIKNHWK